MTAQNLTAQPTMTDKLQHFKFKGLKAMEILAFLAEVMDGGGDGLTLTPDARAGLSHILGDLYSTVGEANEATDIIQYNLEQ